MRSGRGLYAHVCQNCLNRAGPDQLRAEMQQDYLFRIRETGRIRMAHSMMNRSGARPEKSAKEIEQEFIGALFLAGVRNGR